jgi:hypothetical protein
MRAGIIDEWRNYLTSDSYCRHHRHISLCGDEVIHVQSDSVLLESNKTCQIDVSGPQQKQRLHVSCVKAVKKFIDAAHLSLEVVCTAVT